MQRLTKLEHHVIGDVHHRINGADTRPAQALHHIKRCWPGDVHIADDAPQITGTISRRRNLNRQGLIHRRRHRLHHRRAHLSARRHRQIAGDACDTEAVGAIRR